MDAAEKHSYPKSSLRLCTREHILSILGHYLTAPSTAWEYMGYSNFASPNDVDATCTRLLKRVAIDDDDGWRQLVVVYGPVVRYWIRGAGLAGTDLADVFQETFVAVSRNISKFERQDGNAKFRAWLKTVTRSKANDHFRRAAKDPVAYGGSSALEQLQQATATSDVHGDEEGQADATQDEEESLLTQGILQMVKDEFREGTWKSFYRTAVDGRTSQEVAEELGITALAVRKAKSRVMKRLKEALTNTE